ncbi:hypothetical protein GDO81_025506 [Engystomops pustulosus]|uniref:Uncharacterized protein n=1 Tax=Engystomops pustulosus TaxID=76066 RepID=A0AAV6YS74_ENGPU|nr:hypothetical protein GDO81_025506 [Engystomops pustulosus]
MCHDDPRPPQPTLHVGSHWTGALWWWGAPSVGLSRYKYWFINLRPRHDGHNGTSLAPNSYPVVPDIKHGVEGLGEEGGEGVEVSDGSL